MGNSTRLRIFGCLAMVAMLTAGILSAPGEARAAGGDDDDAPTSEYSLTRKALDDGDYDVAINKLALLHETDPDDADVLNLLGYGYRKSGDFAGSVSSAGTRVRMSASRASRCISADTRRNGWSPSPRTAYVYSTPPIAEAVASTW